MVERTWNPPPAPKPTPYLTALTYHYIFRPPIPLYHPIPLNPCSLPFNHSKFVHPFPGPFRKEECDIVSEGAICLFDGRKVLLPDAVPKVRKRKKKSREGESMRGREHERERS